MTNTVFSKKRVPSKILVTEEENYTESEVIMIKEKTLKLMQEDTKLIKTQRDRLEIQSTAELREERLKKELALKELKQSRNRIEFLENENKILSNKKSVQLDEIIKPLTREEKEAEIRDLKQKTEDYYNTVCLKRIEEFKKENNLL